jgi:dTDP-4-dehydrorhamnose reductase
VRIAVTGAGGGLGRAFLEGGAGDHEVHAFTRRDLDVRDLDAVLEAIHGLRPDLVLHLAAMTSVDGCESERRRAADTNVLGSFNVAAAAREAGASLVAMSTDYVFDGEKAGPYDERDPPNPLSFYGVTKLAGERAAQVAAPDALIVRTAWVFGAGNDFLTRAIGRLAAGHEVGGIVDQTGTPTHVRHLARRLVPLARSGLRGVVHLAGPDAVTWHDVLARAARLGNLPGEVVEQKADELARPAPRPANSALTSVRLPDAGIPSMPSLDQAIREVLDRVV